jgi:hypothetical protein
VPRKGSRKPKSSIMGSRTRTETAPPKAQLVTGQYELGKLASLTWNSSLMAS